MIKLTPYKILVYNDVPQLFLAKDQIESNYLCMEIDSGVDAIEYVAVPISHGRFNELILGSADLRDVFESPETGVWYKITTAENDEFIALPLSASDINENFLPEKGFSFNEYNLEPEADLSTGIIGSLDSLYIQALRRKAMYLKLKPVSEIFGGAIQPKDIIRLLQDVSNSYKEYTKDRFYQAYKNVIHDLKKLEATFNDLWKYANLLVCDLKYSSFEVGLSTDIMQDRAIDKDFSDWKMDNLVNYKKDVINHDFTSDDESDAILKAFPDPEVRKRIFDPIINIIDNPRISVQLSDYNRKQVRVLKISKRQREILSPQQSIEEVKSSLFPEMEILQMYIEVPKDRALDVSLSKKLLDQGILFRRITNEFPIVIDKIEFGNITIHLKYPLQLLAIKDGNSYRVDKDELDIHVEASDKDKLKELAIEEFINKYAYYLRIPQSEQVEQFKKIVESVDPPLTSE